MIAAQIASWSPDDRVLAIHRRNPGLLQIGFLDLEDGTIAWVDNGGSSQWGAAFYPDGRWVAYSSNETSAWEVWIRRLLDERRDHDGAHVELECAEPGVRDRLHRPALSDAEAAPGH